MNRKIISFSLLALIISALVFVGSSRSASSQNDTVTFNYTVDRSAVPELYFNDLTLIVNVGDADEIAVLDSNGSSIAYTSGPAADEITFTTSDDLVRVNLTTVTHEFPLGTVRKANLKDNYKWAYSHGFDDNYGLDPTRQVFLDRGVPATYNVVTDWVEVIPGWPGDFTPAELNEIIAAGWGINNHTLDHETADEPNANGCSDSMTREERKADVLATQAQLDQANR